MLCKQFDLPFAGFVQFPEEHDPFFFHLTKIREKMTYITRQIEITPNRFKSIINSISALKNYLSEETSSRNLKSKQHGVFPQHHPGIYSVQKIWQKKKRKKKYDVHIKRQAVRKSG